jgi:hypothetical protein
MSHFPLAHDGGIRYLFFAAENQKMRTARPRDINALLNVQDTTMHFLFDPRRSRVVGGHVYLEEYPQEFGLEFIWRWETVAFGVDGEPWKMGWMLHIRLFGRREIDSEFGELGIGLPLQHRLVEGRELCC